MDQLFTTDPDPFDLVNGVPRDLLGLEPEQLPDGAAYIRVADDVLDDGAVADLVDDAGATGCAAWFALLLAAKAARAYGLVQLQARTFGATFGATAQEASDAVDAMERAGLVWVKRDPKHPRRFHVRVRQWWRWQSMTDAERQRRYRARRALERDAVRESVTPATEARTKFTHEDEDEDEEGKTTPPMRAREADDVKWWHQAADALAFIHQGKPAVLADLAQRIADHRYSPTRRHDERWTADAYQRAAADLQRRFDAGWRPRDGSAAGAIAYYFQTIGSHRTALPDLPPPPPETHTDDRPTPARPRHAGLAAFD